RGILQTLKELHISSLGRDSPHDGLDRQRPRSHATAAVCRTEPTIMVLPATLTIDTREAITSAARSGVRSFTGIYWQREAADRTSPHLAFHPDPAPVQLNELPA